MNQFLFIIKDKKLGGYQKIASLLFLTNAVLFFILALDAASLPNRIILFVTSFILAVYSLYHWRYKKKKERSYVVIYLLIGSVWTITTPAWYFSVLFLAMLILQLRMENDLAIALSPAVVTITGLTKRSYAWTDFHNIILKDGLLTLDFKDNRVIQVEPDPSDPATPNPHPGEDYPQTEKEFNEFCREQLKK